MKVDTFVFNGWAAEPVIWEGCRFPRTRFFDYVELMDGLHQSALESSEAAILVGFSLGGAMAMESFLAYPGKVRGLVLVAASPRPMEDVPTGWKGLTPRRFAALRFGTLQQYADNPSPLFSIGNMERGLVLLNTTDLRERLLGCEAARSPDLQVAILHSERDGTVYPSNAQFLKRVFPQAEVTMVPGNIHAVPLVAPERVDEAVMRMQERLK